MKILRYILLGLLGVLLILALVVTWLINDEAWIEAQIEQAASQALGRQLDIAMLDIDWSMNPVIRAGRVALANPVWADEPSMASIEDLSLSANLGSFLTENWQIHFIRAGEVTVWLESNARDQATWQFDLPPSKASPGTEQSKPLPRIQLTELDVASLQLGFMTAQRSEPLEAVLEGISLRESPDRTASLEFGGTLMDRPVNASARVQPLSALIDGSTSTHDIEFTIGDSQLTSQGQFESSHSLAGADLQFSYSGPDIAAYLEELELPLFTTGAFSIALDVQTTGGGSEAQLQARLGAFEASGEASVENLDSLQNAELTASIQGPNWSGVTQVLGLPGRIEDPFRIDIGLSRSDGRYGIRELTFDAGEHRLQAKGSIGEWPRLVGTDLDASFAGPDLSIWLGDQGNATPIPYLLNANVQDTVTGDTGLRLTLELPDGSLSLEGTLGELPSLNGADLRLRGTGSTDGALVKLLELRPAPVDAVSLDARIQRRQGISMLENVVINIAGHSLEADGQLGDFPTFAGTDLQFELNGERASDWAELAGVQGLPEKAYRLSGRLEPEGELLRLSDTRLELGDNSAVINGLLGDPPTFQGTALTLDIEGTDLSDLQAIPGLAAAPSVPFSARGDLTSIPGGLSLSGIRLSVLGAAATLDAELKMQDRLLGSTAGITLAVDNIARLGTVFGLTELPEGQLTVDADFTRTQEGWEYQLSDGRLSTLQFGSSGVLAIEDGRLDIAANNHFSGPNLADIGDIIDVALPAQPYVIDTSVHYDASTLVARSVTGNLGRAQFDGKLELGPGPDRNGSSLEFSASGPDLADLFPDPEPGEALPFDIQALLTREHNVIQVDLAEATLGPIDLTVTGNFSDLRKLGDTDLNVLLNAPSLEPVGARLGQEWPDQHLRFEAHLLGDPDSFTARALSLELGEGSITGELAVNLEGKPRLQAELVSPYLDLAFLDPNLEEQAPEPEQAPSADGRVIPDDPLPDLKFDQLDAQVSVRFDHIRMPRQQFYDVHAKLDLQDGNLTLDPAGFRANQGGEFQGRFAVAHDNGIPAIELRLYGQDTQISLATFEGQDPARIPRSDFELELAGAGADWRTFASSLEGRFLVDSGEGITANRGLGLIFGDFIGELFNTLNPFAEKEEYTNNVCDVYAGVIESGLVTIGPVVARTDRIRITAEGTIDLNDESLGITFNSTPEKGIGISAGMVLNPFLKLYGTLDAPLIGLDPQGVAVQGTVAVATAGLSLLAKGLGERYLGSKDPCGDALVEARAIQGLD